MANTSANNKRIAKNTLLLYFRMLFMMAVSLYTSRVVLNALGVEDFGIYNVVGGVVAMFSMLSGSLSSAITRFITYELGTGNQENLKKIFSSSVTIQIGLAVLIILFAEAIGVWFLNVKMNIPDARITAANWVFQFSILTFAINLISVPYNASIIAHERMSAFAYISILEAIGKLAIAFLIVISPMDKLIFYAILMCAVALIVRLAYGAYCKRHFEECTYRFIFDKDLLKRMFGFAGWNFIGASSAVLRDQGGNVVINLFCGPTVNAARGIAFQVNSAIQGFVSNFMTALNPQITKSYASGDREYMDRLVCRGARFSYFLLFLFVVPIVCEADYILLLWLKTVPDHAPVFLRLTLFGALMTLLGNSMLTAISATGHIKRYQLWVTVVGSLVFPLTWLAFSLGFPPATTYVIYIIVYFLLVFVRLYVAKGLLHFPVRLYLSDVMLRITVVSGISFISPLLVVYNVEGGFLRLCVTCLVSLVSTALAIYLLGLQKGERRKITGKLRAIVLRFRK